MTSFPPMQWPYLEASSRLLLALAVGSLVGLERERRGHMAGLRTFGLAGLLGALGGIEGGVYGPLSLGLVAMLVLVLNLHTFREASHGKELTTSAALLVVGFAGVLCGQGHTLTPVAVSVVTAALLAWKGTLRDFSAGLSEAELRSAILLAMLAFVIYPALPAGNFGPWDSLAPREAWLTVILIAGIGFVNYILLKIYGSRGLELAGFFGGLINSSVAVAELAPRLGQGPPELERSAARGILWANAAMILRNGALLAMLAPSLLAFCWLPLGGVLLCFAAMARLIPAGHDATAARDQSPIRLESPFSLKSALKFGMVFLLLQLFSVAAQRSLGPEAVYATGLLGGLVSSASTVGALAGLAARAEISLPVAAGAATLASIASLLVNLPLLLRAGPGPMSRRIALGTVVAIALAGFGFAYSG